MNRSIMCQTKNAFAREAGRNSGNSVKPELMTSGCCCPNITEGVGAARTYPRAFPESERPKGDRISRDLSPDAGKISKHRRYQR
jgi:hypothetical protein